MGDTNYVGAIVKILETPKQKFSSKKTPFVQFRVQLPQIRSSKIVLLTFWGNLANDVINYYKINDYVIIEGYLSIRSKSKSNSISQTQKKVGITVLKIYPFLLSYNRSLNKI